MDNSEALKTILNKLDGLEKGQSEIKTNISGLKADVATLKTDVADLKEDSKTTRACVNTLLEWAEKAEVQISIPLYPKAK